MDGRSCTHTADGLPVGSGSERRNPWPCDRQAALRQVGSAIALVMLGLFPLFPSACATSISNDPATSRGASLPTLTREDHGNTIEVQPGDGIIVRLPENPTTGFTWAIDAASDDVLPLQDSEYSAEAGTGVGGGGQRSLTFKAMKAGTVRLQLKLWREWEGDKSVTDRFTVTIRVSGGPPPGKAPEEG
jgi:inhibitor of cysteine peptidase